MKKLLAFVLVLGMASVASAAFQIDPIGGTTVAAGADLELGIDIDADLANFAGGMLALVVNTSDASISGGASTGTAANVTVNGDTSANATIIPPTGEEGRYMFIFNMSGSAITSGTLFIDGLAFNAPSVGTFDVHLYVAPDNVQMGPGDLLDTLSITVIPEPITMSLLGLGGLALIRRRRA